MATRERPCSYEYQDMNTKRFLVAVLVCAFGCAIAHAEEKTVSEKSAEVWDKTKKKTKEISKTVAKKTKETVDAIEHKIDTPDADARKVQVTVTDSGVQMPASLRAGKTAFVVTNNGKEKHNFQIEGEHLDKSFWFAIAPKAAKTMQVMLKAGSYEAHCGIADHAGKESRVKLVVK
jgi:iron uptake system EfeUOB component EfeO/EfeM